MPQTEENPWHLCKDELPKGNDVLCWCSDGKREFIATWSDDTPQGLSGWEIAGVTGEPIAWMPLPKFTNQ